MGTDHHRRPGPRQLAARVAAPARHRVTEVAHLREADVFSLDDGATWYVCAVPLYGCVAVYCHPHRRRTDRSPTIRLDAERDATCLVGGLTDVAALNREYRQVVRRWQRYTSEQRAERASSHRLGPPQQRQALGEYFYVHPALPAFAAHTRTQAAQAGLDLYTTAGWEPGGQITLAALCHRCDAPMVFHTDPDGHQRWHHDDTFDEAAAVGTHVAHPARHTAAPADRWDYDQAQARRYTAPSTT